MSEAQPDINQIAANVIVSATNAVLERATKPTKDSLRRILQSLSNAYQPYLELTFRRVRSIRTFLKPNEPLDLLENYVPVTLSIGETVEEADDVLSSFIGGKRIVVSGIGGRGKSVLMKYFSLCLYHNPRGFIPLFLELRSLNSLSSKEILPYLHSQYRGSGSIQYTDFLRAVENGYFALIFDGFDEIEPNSRSEIEKQILEISRTYEQTPIIVSGRPDDRFMSWDEFYIYNVCPMSYDATKLLIGNADYDSEVKKAFLKKLSPEFFSSHESFLSIPLLAIMLMVTFEVCRDTRHFA